MCQVLTPGRPPPAAATYAMLTVLRPSERTRHRKGPTTIGERRAPDVRRHDVGDHRLPGRAGDRSSALLMWDYLYPHYGLRELVRGNLPQATLCPASSETSTGAVSG